MNEVEFVVEEAGCTSCAARIGEALAEVAAVREIELDEATDAAVVRLSSSVSEETVSQILRTASEGAGHDYRVRPGSWRARALSQSSRSGS